MKKFLRKMAPFVLFIVILEIAVPIAVDPYNVFHWRRIRDNGVEPTATLDELCRMLDCRVEDIIEYVPEQ